MLTVYDNSIRFEARLGPNLRQYLLVNEFGGNVSKVEKFERIFDKTFSENMDKNTVIERKPNGKFFLFHPNFNGIKIPLKISIKEGKTLAQHLLNECSVAYGRAEYVMFQRFIAARVKKGESLDVIDKSSKFLGRKRKPYFTDLIETAKRILAENPKSELDELDFSNMINIQMREIIETPEFQALMQKTFGK